MNKIIQYLKDVQAEMAKVTWPSREELTASTMLVVVMSLAVAVVVRFFDFILNNVIKLFLQ